MAQLDYAHFKAESFAMLPEIGREPFRVVPRSFGDNDKRVGLAPFVRSAQVKGYRFGICLRLRKDNALGPASYPGHQREVAAIPSHHFYEERSLVRGSCDLDAINGLQSDIQRSVHPDCDVRPAQVVVNR